MGGVKKASVSLIRAIAMVFIVACHILQYYDNELCRWFNVGVQIFFIISGYLYGSKAIGDPIAFLTKGFKKILVPYWMFLSFAIALYATFAPDSIRPVDIFKATFCADTIKGLGHLWFVGYILFCYLLTPYLYWMVKKTENFSFAKTLAYYAALLLLVQLVGFAFESYFMPDRVACYLIGFFIPSLATKANPTVKLMTLTAVILAATLMNVARIYFKYLSVGALPDVAVNAIVRYAHLMLGVALFLLLMRVLRKVQYKQWLAWTDEYSYPVYLVHLLFILSPFSLMGITAFQPLNWAFVLAATAILAMLLQKASQKVLVTI